MPIGALEALVELLDATPRLPGNAPLMTRSTGSGWKVITRVEAVLVLSVMVANAGSTTVHARSGRIGGATQLAAQGVSEFQSSEQVR